MDNRACIINTIIFLNSQLFIPSVEELFKFLECEISRFEFDGILKNLINDGNIFELQGYIGIDASISSPVSKRLEVEKNLRPVLKSLSKKLSKVDPNLFLVLGGYFNQKYVLKFLSSDNSSHLITFKFSRFFKKNKYLDFEIYHEIEPLKGTSKEENFYILNSSVVYNTERLYESLVGTVMFNNRHFPNFPLNAINGVRMKNRLEFKKIASSKDSRLNKIFKILGY